MKTCMRIILQRNHVPRSATKLTSGNHAEGFALHYFFIDGGPISLILWNDVNKVKPL